MAGTLVEEQCSYHFHSFAEFKKYYPNLKLYSKPVSLKARMDTSKGTVIEIILSIF
jgi:hypothetical protein